MWPILGFMRDSLLSTMTGGLSMVMSNILLMMFGAAAGCPSFNNGIVLPGGVMVVGVFAGFLCDLAGHKELFHFKGAAGFKCCFECGNVIKHPVVDSPCGRYVGLGCADESKFQTYTDDDIYFTTDALNRVSGLISDSGLRELQKTLGFRHCPSGMLSNHAIRSLLKPTNHCIRDWMHTLAGDGVCNSEIGMLIGVLQDIGVTRHHLQEFSLRCILPKAHGEIHPNWLGASRCHKFTIASFSSIVLSLLPIIFLFLEEFAVSTFLPEHVSCFRNLVFIVGLLQTGPEEAMRYTADLDRLFKIHHDQFWQLYAAGIKPKVHHARHIVDGMRWLGKCLSCFVTERKHRVVKGHALHIFRHYEHTLTDTVLHSQIETIRDQPNLFKHTFHINPRRMSALGENFIISKSLVCAAGQLKEDDLIYTSSGVAGRVIRFWSRESNEEDVLLEINAYDTIGNDTSLRDEQKADIRFVDVASVVAPCIWFYVRPSIIRLFVPVAMLF